MARKLRFQVGDYVIWKGRGEIALGKVIYINQLPIEDRKKWGVFGYIVDWGQNEYDLSNEGWCIKDITEGGLSFIENPDTFKVLYGRKEV